MIKFHKNFKKLEVLWKRAICLQVLLEKFRFDADIRRLCATRFELREAECIESKNLMKMSGQTVKDVLPI